MSENRLKLLQLLEKAGSVPFKLREIGRLAGIRAPQLVKHYLLSMEKLGIVTIDRIERKVYMTTTAEGLVKQMEIEAEFHKEKYDFLVGRIQSIKLLTKPL